MKTTPEVMMSRREKLEALFLKHGYTDFKWIDPGKIVVSQWGSNEMYAPLWGIWPNSILSLECPFSF